MPLFRYDGKTDEMIIFKRMKLKISYDSQVQANAKELVLDLSELPENSELTGTGFETSSIGEVLSQYGIAAFAGDEKNFFSLMNAVYVTKTTEEAKKQMGIVLEENDTITSSEYIDLGDEGMLIAGEMESEGNPLDYTAIVFREKNVLVQLMIISPNLSKAKISEMVVDLGKKIEDKISNFVL